MKTINIKKELKILPINNYKEYLNPELIYIPIKDINYLTRKKNDLILKGDIVYQEKNNIIYSSISGIVKGIIEIRNDKYLLIQNDFKETTINNGKSIRINKISQDNFLNLINNILNIKIDHNIDKLYINCLDIDPYIFNKYTYLKEEMKDLLSFVKNMANILKINKIYLVITNDYQDIINKYSIMVLETGLVEFKIVNNIYPIGNDLLLAKQLVNNKNELLINLNDIIKLIYGIKKKRPITEKYITVNGNNAKNPIVLKVKKYSLVTDLLKISNNFEENIDYTKNNSLYSKLLNVKMTIVDDNLNGIIMNRKDTNKELLCNNCGLCYNVCPVKINPLMKNNKCLKCGLCNYVCPHKINVVERYQK